MKSVYRNWEKLPAGRVTSPFLHQPLKICHVKDLANYTLHQYSVDYIFLSLSPYPLACKAPPPSLRVRVQGPKFTVPLEVLSFAGVAFHLPLLWLPILPIIPHSKPATTHHLNPSAPFTVPSLLSL